MTNSLVTFSMLLFISSLMLFKQFDTPFDLEHKIWVKNITLVHQQLYFKYYYLLKLSETNQVKFANFNHFSSEKQVYIFRKWR